MKQALANVRVLDLSTSVAGAWCSRMLADFGADVVLVEPAEGHPLRSEAPFDDAGRSIAGSLFLANRRSVTLNLRTGEGRERVRDLGGRVDVVISSHRPSELARSGMDYGFFANERLVFCHLTPFGMTGERAEMAANELTVAALSGWASVNGDADRPPLRPSGHQVGLCAGTAAYGAIVAALVRRERTGRGDEIDIAELEVMVSTASPAILRAQYSGGPQPRREAVDITSGPVPVADGHFALTISRAHFWRDAMHVLGLDDLAEDPRWEAAWYRAAHKDEYVERVGAAMAQREKSELFEELAARRVVAGPVLTMAELAENEHLAARAFWAELEGEVYPGAPFKMSETPWALRSAASAPGREPVEAAE